jgi:adenylate cyclase
VNKDAGSVFVWQQDFARAIQYYEKSVAIFPEDLHSWDILLMSYRALGNDAAELQAARRMLTIAEEIVEREPQNHYAFGRGANALVVLGDLWRAKEWVDRALLIAPDNIDIRYNFACSLFGNSETFELGLDELEYVLARSTGSIIRRIDIDADLDPVREHPRFKKLLEAAEERIAKLDAANAPEIPNQPAGAGEQPRS